MAENRFYKGVKAAKERTAEIEAQKNLNQETKQEVIEQPVDEPKANTETTESKFDVAKIFSEKPKKKKALAKTFYMSEENMDKLEKIAKSQKISVSKALNEILANIL